MTEAEFARIALPHLDAAYTLAHWLLRDRAAAEDVVQDAMLRAMRYFASYTGGNARAWLLRIVRNVAYDRLNHPAGRAEQPLDLAAEMADPAPDPEASFARREGEARLRAVLAALSAELRECLVLREFEDMSYRDIARITEVPVGTVMSRLFRARQALLTHGRAVAAKERLP